MTDEMINKAIEELSTAISKVDDKELIERFLKCLLTESEINGVASRWALVRQIDKGVTQRTIANDLGISLCKITRGSKELKKENSAFKQIIDIYENKSN